jgi:hypothetical protein
MVIIAKIYDNDYGTILRETGRELLEEAHQINSTNPIILPQSFVTPPERRFLENGAFAGQDPSLVNRSQGQESGARAGARARVNVRGERQEKN